MCGLHNILCLFFRVRRRGEATSRSDEQAVKYKLKKEIVMGRSKRNGGFKSRKTKNSEFNDEVIVESDPVTDALMRSFIMNDVKLEQFSGYTKSMQEDFSSSEESKSVCLVTRVSHHVRDEIDDLFPEYVEYGDWIITTGSCNDVKGHGPFETMEEAFEYSHKEFGATSFR
mgnify:CR=1 FL=1